MGIITPTLVVGNLQNIHIMYKYNFNEMYYLK